MSVNGFDFDGTVHRYNYNSLDNIPPNIAPAYSASATYAVGDYCTKDNVLYKCSTAINTAEAWNSAHWTQVQLATDVADLKDDLSDIEDAIAAIVPGLSEEAKEALLACFAHVAWIDDDGQDYYDALEAALDVTPSIIPLYSLPEATIFTGSNDINTNVEMEWGKIYTIFLEYSPDVIDSSIRAVVGVINSSNTNKYQAVQIGTHWSTGNKNVWGFGLTQPGDVGATNAGIGALARHVIIIDCTGTETSGIAVFTHHYKNISNDSWSGDYTLSTITQEVLEGYGPFVIASSLHPNIYNYSGMVSEFKIYDRLMASDAIQNFLLNGPEQPSDPTLVYALSEPTAFNGTNYIDTGFTLSTGGVWTILLEYEPSEISSSTLIDGNYRIDFVLSNAKTGESNYAAIQISMTYIGNSYKPTVWGMGLGWQDSVSNAGVGDIMRHAIVIDTREGSASEGKFLYKHWFKNRTKSISNSYTQEPNTASLRTDTSFLLGGTREINSRTKNFRGRVTTCRILARELDSTAINMFTTYGRW